ncbi:hypothetical protein PC118_g14676 [Phytophthora cactorum]|uniref:Uncharacterized protein n=1 Tax=Phytophthora cactorum TaxID=29920 RepID=A0A8T0YSQ6_9STRA|nr:hypothetical protein PC112_g14605 [Phytophthora cactorum]KAG2815485.1 hypothetical protein PC111_g13546 [Phytophthora cactorum]KAG2852741.1 hypothetical protein PC113_g14768 [Phytophthora cactorum]KAG2974204.1 hypothetical protein PC118_g14676 [Phytophthora cactorum]KAG3004585.1 hypothetical protein PC119_g15587 [Phytophthora cactorum]
MTATPQGDTVECRDLSGRGSSCKLQLNGAETLLRLWWPAKLAAEILVLLIRLEDWGGFDAATTQAKANASLNNLTI